MVSLHNRASLILSIAILISTDIVAAVDSHLNYRSSWEKSEPGDSVFFDDPEDQESQLLLDLSFEGEGAHAAFTIGSIEENESSTGKFVLTEAYKDFGYLGLDFTLGKKRIDWGVGYAYRPLNFMTTESLNTTGVVVNEGTWVASVEKYTETGTLALQLFNTNTQLKAERPHSTGAGVRYYSLLGDWEFQVLGFYDDARQWMVGGSANTVVGNSASVHGSVFWQKKYSRFTHAADRTSFSTNTVEEVNFSNGLQALLGVTYNFSNNTSLLAEYWYDGRSPSGESWGNLIEAGLQQSQMSELLPVLSAERQIFSQTNTVQHNVLLHARYEGLKFSPVLDVQISPEDSGVISTARLAYEWRPAHNIEIGSRWFGGNSESVYRQLPKGSIFFIRIDGSFS